MKRIARSIITMMLLVCCLMLASLSVSAASAPGKVKKVTASAGETSITLKWGKVSKASGYNIYQLNSAGTPVKIASTSKTSYTVKNRVPNTTYKFQVRAYKKSGKTVLSGDLSPIVSSTPRYKTPGAPSGLRHSSSKDRSITIKWSAGKNATGYEIYMKEGSKGSYKLVGSTKTKAFTKTGLTIGQSYTFKVRSYRTYKGKKVSFSSYTKTVTVTATGMTADAKAVHGAYFNATLKSTITTKNYTTGKNVTVKKGTKVTATTNSGTVTCYLSNGNKLKISSSKLKFTSLNTTKKDYTTKQKQDFVNGRAYSSPSKYLIWISQYSLRVNIFKGSQGKWKLTKSMICCVGKMSTRTPRGVFKILSKTTRYGAPSLNFTPYSVKYDSQNAFHLYVDSTRQAAASHGCVRLSRTNLNWMAKNCPVGTTVVSY